MVTNLIIRIEHEIAPKARGGSIRKQSPNDIAHKLGVDARYFISHNSMQRLDNERWLNDEIINFYMKILEIYSAEHTDMKVKCQKSYFMEKILPRADDEICYDYEAIKRWMRERVEEFDIILYPINIVQQHWALTVVYTNAKRNVKN